MDNKTSEKVLAKIIINRTPYDVIDFTDSELEETFGLSSNEAKSALASLEHKGAIKITASSDNWSILILPSAFGYFAIKEEQEQQKHKEKESERNWDWVQIGIGLISGIILTVLGILLNKWLN